jgi:hypothetical protein
MWEVRNRTPFAAAGNFDRDSDGREAWCVAVRGTFDLVNGSPLKPSEVQDEAMLAPIYAGADSGELVSEHDICPFITATDILLAGIVVPPKPGLPQLPITIRVGALTKSATVFGPRTAEMRWRGWQLAQEGTVGDTELTWRNSFGGEAAFPKPAAHPENPVGIGYQLMFSKGVESGTTQALPLIDRADSDLIGNPKAVSPVGFGPVPRHWQPRLPLAGTYDASWEQHRAPLLPKDFDPRFYNTAPADQVASGFLRGGEDVELTGMFPEGPMKFRLPQVIFTGHTRLGTARHDSRFALARVVIDLTSRRLSMVWIMALPCNGQDDMLEYTYVQVKQMAGVA